MSLLELLVALTITMIFIGSVAAAFVQIIRASDEAEAVIRAHASARAAVDQIARELRQVRLDSNPLYQQFNIIDRPLAYGNNVDEDGDGSFDEDIIDGVDNDGDWTVASDQHATIGTMTERPDYVGVADLGDLRVDEDHRFSNDEVSYIIPPRLLGIDPQPRRRISYRLGTFDGEQNVLLRVRVDDPPAFATGTEEIEPVVFDVVSLDLLAWNANDNAVGPVPDKPYWQSDWDATSFSFPFQRPSGAPFGVPPFKLPAAVFVSATVNAERLPLSDLPVWTSGNRPLKTVTMSTVVNIESVIQDSRYFFYVRQ